MSGVPVAQGGITMGYQPNINCRHFYRGQCAHPVAWRPVLPNKPCILRHEGVDPRPCECSYREPYLRPAPPPEVS